MATIKKSVQNTSAHLVLRLSWRFALLGLCAALARAEKGHEIGYRDGGLERHHAGASIGSLIDAE